MEFRALGALDVAVDGTPLALGGPKQRALLAALLVRPNEVVSASQLIDALWDDDPPRTARAALQVHISQLRKALGPDRIVTRRSGYLLRIDAGELDTQRFETLIDQARGGAATAEAQVREALGLWHGPPFAEFGQRPFAAPEATRLEELRLAAEELRVDHELALGRHAALVPELEAMVRTHPYREGLRARLMTALYRSGRQAEALAAYRAARETLVEQLGIEPGAALRQLERAILDQDPALDLVMPEAPADSAAQAEPGLEGRASFVGRTRELREIRALLSREEVRLLTLTGAAGSGKTRLALEVTGVSDGRASGAVLVELGRITDAALVARTIADRLGAKEKPGHSAREALLEHLRDRDVLLLLDNFEHVLEAASFVRELVASAPGVKLLVTSRAPLGVPEERVYPVPALELPDRSQRPSLGELGETEAIQLFLERARAARPDFELSETNAESLIELCVRLDGLPLALELAAARCNLLSPRALLERIGSRLDLLRATPGSGLVERQWTLRGAIEWSYDLLQPEEQQLFTSLAVFVGGFTVAAAERVAEQPELDILEGVESLFRNNLLSTEQAPGDEPRLGMLETIREYALERLVARGNGERVRRRHATFYVALAEEAEPGLLGPQQREWLERLDSERDNIRAALGWAVEAGEAEMGLRIGSALWRFWQLRNHELEARERLEELLALGTGSARTRAKAQTMIGSLSFVLGDFDTAQRVLHESLPLHRRFGDVRMISSTLGILAVTCGDPDSALALSREALEVARTGDEQYLEGHGLFHVGTALMRVGEIDDAERAFEDAISIARSCGNLRSVGSWQKSLAGIAIIRGDHARARRLLEESLAIHRDLADAWGVSHSLSNLSFLALEAGDAATARTLLSEALAIERESGHQPRLANVLEMSARLAAADGQPALATRLYARAALLRERIHSLTCEVGWPDPTPNLGDLRSRVGEEAFAEEWARGRAMTIIAAIDQAIEAQREPKPNTL